MKFDAVYYEPAIFDYPLGRQLREEYRDLPWIPIESHNSIREMQEKPNDQFGHMKRNLIAGIRKTHKYVENHKVSDYLVPYTSSGCTAMCLYCYLVCNYNKCSYLRLFVNREEMLDKINKLGIGPGGLGGTTTALAVNVNTYPTHIAGLPVGINICCHVNRHARRVL